MWTNRMDTLYLFKFTKDNFILCPLKDLKNNIRKLNQFVYFSILSKYIHHHHVTNCKKGFSAIQDVIVGRLSSLNIKI